MEMHSKILFTFIPIDKEICIFKFITILELKSQPDKF
jgi:hypothetical protein